MGPWSSGYDVALTKRRSAVRICPDPNSSRAFEYQYPLSTQHQLAKILKLQDLIFSMQEEFYFDTSIWLDIHEKRDNSDVAKKLMERIIKEDYKVAYSDLTISELKQLNYSQQEINIILKVAKPNNIKRVHFSKEQIKEGTKLAKKRNIPKKDAIHAVICRDNNLQLISRDEHFAKLKDVTTAKKPEEFT